MTEVHLIPFEVVDGKPRGLRLFEMDDLQWVLQYPKASKRDGLVWEGDRYLFRRSGEIRESLIRILGGQIYRARYGSAAMDQAIERAKALEFGSDGSLHRPTAARERGEGGKSTLPAV